MMLAITSPCDCSVYKFPNTQDQTVSLYDSITVSYALIEPTNPAKLNACGLTQQDCGITSSILWRDNADPASILPVWTDWITHDPVARTFTISPQDLSILGDDDKIDIDLRIEHIFAIDSKHDQTENFKVTIKRCDTLSFERNDCDCDDGGCFNCKTTIDYKSGYSRAIEQIEQYFLEPDCGW